MIKYRSEDYYSVINKRTGKKIADCADQMDALMMVSFDPNNRVIATNKVLMSPVVDIEIQKELPTNEIVSVHDVISKNIGSLLTPKRIKLPEGQGKPLRL